MVARRGKWQCRFTAGALDPLMFNNTAVELFETGAAQMQNVRPLPQGGFTLNDGTLNLGRVRNLLTQIAGTGPAAITDNNPAKVLSVTGVTTTLAEAARITFNGTFNFCAVDLLGFAATLPSGALPTNLPPSPPLSPAIFGSVVVQYLTPAAVWMQLDATQPLTDTNRYCRFALPPGNSFAATAVRVLVSSTTSGGVTFVLAEMPCWQETATPSPVRVRAFAESAAAAYDLVFTAGSIEIYGAGGRVASLPSPWQAYQIPLLKNAQELDTMVVCHQDTAPQTIQRQGSDRQWSIYPTLLNNVPLFDFGDVNYTNGVAAQWQLQFYNFDTQLASGTPQLPAGGVHYKITVNATDSAAVQQVPNMYVSPNPTNTAAAVQSSILSIPGIGPGVTVTAGSGGTTNQSPVFTVIFGGAVNAGDQWAIAGTPLDKSDAAITAAKLIVGIAGGEPVMSASRGWPACCLFAQGRLIYGGLKGAPNALLFSETGDYWQLDTRMEMSTAAFLAPMDMPGSDGIAELHQGRTISVFTQHGEYWLEPAQLSRTAPPSIVYASGNGIAPGVAAVEISGSAYYMQAGGSTLFQFMFDYALQNMRSLSKTAQATSLVAGVIDAVLRPMTGSSDLNEIWFAQSGGKLALASVLEEQQIFAISTRATDGQFLAVNVNARFEVSVAVLRQVNGTAVQFYERMVAGLVLDCQESFTVTTGQTVLAGLFDLAGASNVWGVVDGLAQGPFTVTSTGVLTLNFPALANGEALVGRWTPPIVDTLPPNREIAPNTVMRRPGRIHTIKIGVVNTTSVALAANGGAPYDVSLAQFGGPVAVPLLPYSGEVNMEGLPGYAADPQMRVTQVRPGALTVTFVSPEIDL